MAKLLDEFKAKQLKKQAEQNKKIEASLNELSQKGKSLENKLEVKFEIKSKELDQKIIALPIQELKKSINVEERKNKEQDEAIIGNEELVLKTKEALKVHTSDKKAHPSEETIKNIIDIKIPPEKWTKLTDGGYADDLHKHLQDEFAKHKKTISRGGSSVVRRNSTGTEIARRRLNFIEGTDIGLTIADDTSNNEIDITINNTGAISSEPYVTIGTTTGLTAERALTGTADQITIVDNGANSTAVISIATGYVGQTSITTLGTVTTGTWTGTDIAVADGGTGVSTLADAGVLIGNGTGAVQVTGAGTSGQVLTSNGAGVDPTFQAATGFADPMTTRGDIIIRNSSNATARLGIGALGTLLRSDGTDIGWTTVETTLGQFNVRVTKSANQTITTSTNTVLSFNVESFDNGSLHDNVTNNSRLTVPTGAAGRYLVFGMVAWGASATGTRFQSVLLNGATLVEIASVLGDGTFGSRVPFVYAIDLVVGDYIELNVWHNHGSDLVVNGAADLTTFGMARLAGQ